MASPDRADALVLDLDTRAGLAIARALGRQGLRVVVASRDGSASGMRTRYAIGHATLPEPEDDFAAYADAIVALVHRHPVDAILPSIDSSVLALHRRRIELGDAAPAVGSVDAVETAISKPRTLELAEQLGITIPHSVHAQSSEDMQAAIEELGMPVVVKPDESWRDDGIGGERLAPMLVGSTEQHDAARRLAPALVQEYAPGVRETIKLFRVDGQVVARFAMRIERCWPSLGGSSVLRESVEAPRDILEWSEKLVGAIGLDGYSEVEWRRREDGQPLLMEVNPRLSQSVELAIRAGVDFARMQLEWARGGRVEPVGPHRTGMRLGWLAGDARLGPSGLRDYVRGAHIEGVALDDPVPMLGAAAFTIRHLGTRFLSASRR
ncbi:MAG TPA: ATP-grasp domain-containing protein [Gaiellaceae bacterium]|nr:ATP-grasp domain-containing protein [Gaiellaceae bacterium]